MQGLADKLNCNYKGTLRKNVAGSILRTKGLIIHGLLDINILIILSNDLVLNLYWYVSCFYITAP